jgi:hypothetical protein
MGRDVGWLVGASRDRSPGRLAWASALVLSLSCAACGKKESKPIEVAGPPKQGQASFDALNVSLGMARGLDPEMAPSSARFSRVWVLSATHAVLTGQSPEEAVSLVTTDGGKTFRSMRTKLDEWGSWGVSGDGAIAFLGGAKYKPVDPRAPKAPPKPAVDDGKPKPPPPTLTHALLDGTRFTLAEPEASLLPPPVVLIDPTEPPKDPRKAKDPRALLPLALEPVPAGGPPHEAWMLFEEASGPKLTTSALVWGTRERLDPASIVRFPKDEQVIPVTYGHGQILSVKGKQLMRRAPPKKGAPLAAPEVVGGLLPTKELVAELSSKPECATFGVTVQRITLPAGKGVPAKPAIFVVSDAGVFFAALPPTATGALGCTPTQVAVELRDPAVAEPSVAVCPFVAPAAPAPPAATATPSAGPVAPPKPAPKPLPGKVVVASVERTITCKTPPKAPFRMWADKHDDTFALAPTEEGVIALMSSSAGDRWGLYLAASYDKEKLIFEPSRAVGEGSGDRGRVELVAVIPFGKRTVVLFGADVAGTTRRGFYSIASDDGGNTWSAQ